MASIVYSKMRHEFFKLPELNNIKKIVVLYNYK